MVNVIISAAFTFVFGLGLKMTGILNIILLFTSIFAIVSNLLYWVRMRSKLRGIAGSSIAHIGFGLVILGALISNANKTIISQNRAFIHKEFPANENLLIEQNDTVQMGPYWVTYTGERQGSGSTSHYNYYDLEFYRESEKSGLVFDFSLAPSIQKNERMGNVPEPSTKHYATRDIYTHVTYADMRTPEEKAGNWEDEFTFYLDQGEQTTIYKDLTVTLDSVVADMKKDDDGNMAFIVLGASLSIEGAADTTIHAVPIYMVKGEKASSIDAELMAFGLKFQIAGIDRESNKPILKVWRQAPDEQPFILIQAIVFPMINLLWIGGILMALGTFWAVWQRILIRQKSAA